MIINHTYRFIFLHVPKTAGTSLTSLLSTFTGWNDIELGGTHYGEQIQSIYGRRFKLHKHSPAFQVRNVVGDALWQDYFTFAVVRHPLDRVISAYRFYQQWDHPSVEPARQLPTLEAFLTSDFFHRDRLNCTRATGSQSRFLDSQGGGPVDLTCRFEHLHNDVTLVAKRIGVPLVELPQLNTSKRSDTDDEITPRIRDLVAEVYAEDLANFDYDLADCLNP